MEKINLILPVYNESKLILNTLKEINKYFNDLGYDYEIVVVDDKSTDNSVEVIKKFNHPKVRLICKNRNQGKGSAIRKGVRCAVNEYIGFMDADLPYSLSNIGDMIRELKNCDVVVGSRRVRGSKIESPPLWYRFILGKMFRGFRDLIFNLNIKDTQSGLKFFRRDAVKDIFSKQKINGFGFDVETLYIARKKRYKIKEVPVHLLRKHSFKKSKLNPIMDSLKIFSDLFLIKINDFFGRYK